MEYETREIPAPYNRIICQLLAEDRHGDSHNSHGSLQRQSYARRVLDKFTAELKLYNGSPTTFRSHVLSPILARQFYGVPDSSAATLRDCVLLEKDPDSPVTIGDATEFYLGLDLTDPKWIPHYRVNIVNIVEAMWHLAVVMGVIHEKSITQYNNFRTHYDYLMEALKILPGSEDDQNFNEAEIEMILDCKVEDFFEEELEDVVHLVMGIRVMHC